MSRWVLALGFLAIGAVLSTVLAGEGLQTIRGSVEVYHFECVVPPCKPPIVQLAVPGRKERIRLTGDASKELVELAGEVLKDLVVLEGMVEVVGTFDTANPNKFEVKTFKVLHDEKPRK